MNSQDVNLIWGSFERAAAHLSNIEQVRYLLEQTILEAEDLTGLMQKLTDKMQSIEITIKTDIRIFLNEVEHCLRKRGHHI